MDWQNEKCVMVIDESLPRGIIANTAAILGITLGKKIPEAVGSDVIGQSGKKHRDLDRTSDGICNRRRADSYAAWHRDIPDRTVPGYKGQRKSKADFFVAGHKSLPCRR